MKYGQKSVCGTPDLHCGLLICYMHISRKWLWTESTTRHSFQSLGRRKRNTYIKQTLNFCKLIGKGSRPLLTALAAYRHTSWWWHDEEIYISWGGRGRNSFITLILRLLLLDRQILMYSLSTRPNEHMWIGAGMVAGNKSYLRLGWKEPEFIRQSYFIGDYC